MAGVARNSTTQGVVCLAAALVGWRNGREVGGLIDEQEVDFEVQVVANDLEEVAGDLLVAFFGRAKVFLVETSRCDTTNDSVVRHRDAFESLVGTPPHRQSLVRESQFRLRLQWQHC